MERNTSTLLSCCERSQLYPCWMSEISTCYSGPMLCSTTANSSHMQPIFCLCDPRCLDVVSLSQIKAAFDKGCSGAGTPPPRQGQIKYNQQQSASCQHVSCCRHTYIHIHTLCMHTCSSESQLRVSETGLKPQVSEGTFTEHLVWNVWVVVIFIIRTFQSHGVTAKFRGYHYYCYYYYYYHYSYCYYYYYYY